MHVMTMRATLGTRLREVATVTLFAMFLVGLLLATCGSYAATGIEGAWESKQYGYAFSITGDYGIATASNSPKYSVNDLILEISSRTASSFSGKQIFSDGNWHSVTGNVQSDGSLLMAGAGLSWKMVRTGDATGPSGMTARQCSVASNFAALSEFVYSCDKPLCNVTPPKPWVIVHESRPPLSRASGFHAIAVRNIFTGRVALVFEGTKFLSLSDWSNNIQHPLKVPPQYQEALNFANEVFQSECQGDPACISRIVTTGHSLGGGQAHTVALNYGLVSYIYNPAGLWDSTAGKLDTTVAAKSDVTLFQSAESVSQGIQLKDVVTRLGVQFNASFVEVPTELLSSKLGTGNASGTGILTGTVSGVIGKVGVSLADFVKLHSIENLGEWLGKLCPSEVGVMPVVMPASDPAAPYSGRWLGTGNVGSQIFPLMWELEQQGGAVSGVVTVKDPASGESAQYSIIGKVPGGVLEINGDQFLGAHRSQFCMATSKVSGLKDANGEHLRGGWGGQAVPGGCPASSSGNLGLTLVKNYSPPTPQSQMVQVVPQVPGFFDGEWHSCKYNYSFLIKGTSGVATLSNSPTKYKVGDVMLKIDRINGSKFTGSQIYTNGQWYPVTGELINNGLIRMAGTGLVWDMIKK